MRTINEIIIHCTATSQGCSVESIRRNHVEVRKFKDIGYHYIIMPDGKVEVCRPLWQVGAHCKFHNLRTIGIAWLGGKDGKKDMTAQQKFSLGSLVSEMVHWTIFPIDTLSTHHFYNKNKSCPNYTLKDIFPDFILYYFKHLNG